MGFFLVQKRWEAAKLFSVGVARGALASQRSNPQLPAMLPSTKRLRSSDVERVLGRGLSFVGGSIRGKAFPRASVNVHSRFAVVVSKKVAGTAVVRNLLRRWAFEVIARSSLPSAPHDVVLMIPKKYETFAALKGDMEAALGRLVQMRGRA